MSLKFDYFSSQYAIHNNSNNHADYAPFIFTDTITIIDIDYFNYLPERLQNILHHQISDITIDKISYPHSDQHDHQLFPLLYEIFIEQYREEYWYKSNIISWSTSKFMIKITKDDVSYLVEKNEPPGLAKRIDNLMKNSLPQHGEIFFKLSCGSVKHDELLVPVRSRQEIIEKIINSRRLQKDLFKVTLFPWKRVYLIITPWLNLNEHCEEESEKYEYRVFLDNGKIRAISQQNWNKVYLFFNNDEREHIYNRMVELFDQLDVKRGVCDVWYDKKSDKCWLIEINAFGPGLSAGSASFHWIRDKDILWKGDVGNCIWRVIC